MAEPKAKTLIQQLGFFDKDLKTDSHDQIMIWLQENAHSAINRLFFNPWSKEYLDLLISNTKKQLEECIPELEKRTGYQKTTEEDIELLRKLKEWDGIKEYPKREPIEISKLEWEKAIDQSGYGNRKFTIGFIDMAITYYYQSIRISGIPINPNNRLDITEYSVPEWKIDTLWDTVYIEVKTKTPSLGELLRQLNLYRSHLPGKYVVVSPDSRFKDILFNQGVRLLTPFV